MTPAATGEERWIWRARVAAVCLALVAVTFRQQPGRLVADTKLDLTMSPWSFMASATHLWDPTGAFGQLQNQAYGYLFPMAPFHALLLSAGLPGWVVQRLWWSLLLCLAFVGFWRLSGALRMGGGWGRLVGATLYALSPRIASELTITSIEVWPMALAPWVLWPLVDPRHRTWWWRTGMSALAVALCGGVNAVATGAVLILPGLWFLTREWTRRTFLQAGSWLAACLVAMAWWIGPLLLLGRYSPPFLDWIESSAVTSSTASPFEALRGTSAWLGFLATPLGPEWPGGWLYATQPVLIIVTTLVAAVGLVGLTLDRSGHAPFLVVALVVGLALTTLGWNGPLRSPLADQASAILDGPLAALRNAHKFDLVVRIPILLGLVSLLSRVEVLVARARSWRLVARVVTVALAVAAIAPSLTSALPRQQAYTSIPQYWKATAQWLDEQPGSGAVLVLPAASFADFAWGSTKDDPLQAMMRRPLVARDAVPLGSAGATRLLDGLIRSIGTGRAEPGLVSTLRSAAIAYVVVRNDLRSEVQGDPLIAVHASMAHSGLSVVRHFGPTSANLGDDEATTLDYRTHLKRPMVEIYGVPDPSAAVMQPLGTVATVAGGPEDLGRIHEAAGDSLFLLGSDAAGVGGRRHIVTDGLRRSEVNFGAVTHNRSHVLTRTEAVTQSRAAHDYVADRDAPMTTTTWQGIRGVTASSSASDATASLRLGPASRPGAALDGDARTRWVSGTRGNAVGEWLQVDLAYGSSPRQVSLTLSADYPVESRPASVRVSTERGDRFVPTAGTLGPVLVSLPEGSTSFVRVTLDAVEPGTASGFSIAELALEGVEPMERLLVPAAGSPDTILLGDHSGERDGCLAIPSPTYCSPRLHVPAEGPAALARRLELDSGGDYAARGEVRARSGPAVDALLKLPNRLSATSSSRLVEGPLNRPDAAVDGDFGTAWVAGTTDFGPSYRLALPKEREITALQFVRPTSLAASSPRLVTLTFSDGSTESVEVRRDGFVEFPARVVDTISMQFGATYPLVDVDSRNGERTYVPVGFAEVQILGAEELSTPMARQATTGAECGFGPVLVINGTSYPTEVTGTIDDIVQDRSLTWRLCGSGSVSLPDGVIDIEASPTIEFEAVALTLQRQRETGAPSGAPTVSLQSTRPSPSTLTVEAPSRSAPQLVAVPQNFNSGWRAEVEGQTLAPVRVNGWMQGWVLPPGKAVTVHALFEPDSGFRAFLLGGGVLLVVSGSLVWVRGRRTAPGRGQPLGAGAHHLWIAAVAGGCAWGIPAMLAAAAVALVWWKAPRRLAGAASAGAALALPSLASVLVAAAPWPGGRVNVDSVVVQLCIITAVTAIASWTLLSPHRAAPAFRRRMRMMGRSSQ